MKNVLKFLIIFSFLIIVAVPAYADGPHPQGITLDGTLGTAGKLSLPGPDYDIKAGFGKQAGANLFHSFGQFNIHQGESATFTGPDSVQNIISRVTGGNASWIDGRLASAIPNADLYFLNPAGVMFGPNASLDLSGSFHVSTADYLRLGENERFYAMPQTGELLSAASPSAFGFLGNNVAGISYEGKGEITEQEWENSPSGLQVKEGKTVSLIGGNIEIGRGTYYRIQKTDEDGNPVFEEASDENGNPLLDEEGNPVPVLDENGDPVPVTETVFPGDIKAPGGRIDIAAAASAGEVIPTETGLNVTSSEKGKITLSDKSLIDAGGTGGGSIFIRGGEFVAENSTVQSETLGNTDGGQIDIQTDTLVMNGSDILANTEGSGNAPDIYLRANRSLTVSGENSEAQPGGIFSVSGESGQSGGDDLGDSGNIRIEAENISFKDGALVSAVTYGGGQGGNLTLTASESLSFSGENSSARSTQINGSAYSESENAGNAGELNLKAGGTVSFSGKSSDDRGSMIESATLYTGDGGSLTVEAENISLSDGAFMMSDTFGQGKAGNIMLRAGESIALSNKGRRGTETLGTVSGTVRPASTADRGGEIVLEAGDIRIDTGAEINAKTSATGNAGNITLRADRTVSISGSDTKGNVSRIYSGSEGTTADSGTGGEIMISAQTLSLSDKGEISTSSTGGGKAGNIRLNVNQLRMDTESSVSSGSGFANIYAFDTVSDRDNGILILGDVVEVADPGESKSGRYVNIGTLVTYNSPIYQAANLNELDEMTNQNSLKNGDVASVSDAGNGTASDFVFLNGEWIKFNNIHEVAGNFEKNNLVLAQTGNVANVKDTGNGNPADFIYSGRDWVPLTDIRAVTDMAAKDELSAQAGDTVKVLDAGEGKAETFLYADGAWIPFAGGDAGTVSITADSITMENHSSITTSSQGHGNAGDIALTAAQVKLDTGASVSSGSNSTAFGGDAGSVTVHTSDSLGLSRDASLNTEAKSAGGGKIFANSGKKMYLLDSAITSSVKQGQGKGGDVSGDSELMILNHSRVTANAEEGDGGAIFIRTENFIKSADSAVTATSARGNQGTVKIEAPDTDISGSLTLMPGNFLDAAQWLSRPCSERGGEPASRFVIRDRDAVPTAPDDLQPAPTLWYRDPER